MQLAKNVAYDGDNLDCESILDEPRAGGSETRTGVAFDLTSSGSGSNKGSLKRGLIGKMSFREGDPPSQTDALPNDARQRRSATVIGSALGSAKLSSIFNANGQPNKNPTSPQAPNPPEQSSTQPSQLTSKQSLTRLVKKEMGPHLPSVPQTTQPVLGRLEVQVVSAKDLLAADSCGTSDPYCIVYTDQQRVQTNVCPKTLNPDWRKTFILDIFESTSHITFLLYDEDSIIDDFLGTVSVPLQELTAPSCVNKSISMVLGLLPSQDNKPAQGSISVVFKYTREAHVEDNERVLLQKVPSAVRGARDFLPRPVVQESLIAEQEDELDSSQGPAQNQPPTENAETPEAEAEPEEDPNTKILQQLLSQIETLNTDLKNVQNQIQGIGEELKQEVNLRTKLGNDLHETREELIQTQREVKTTMEEIEEKSDQACEDTKECRAGLRNVDTQYWTLKASLENVERTAQSQSQYNRDFERKINDLELSVRAVQQKQTSKFMQFAFFMIAFIIQIPGISQALISITTTFARVRNVASRVRSGSTAGQPTTPTPTPSNSSTNVMALENETLLSPSDPPQNSENLSHDEFLMGKPKSNSRSRCASNANELSSLASDPLASSQSPDRPPSGRSTPASSMILSQESSDYSPISPPAPSSGRQTPKNFLALNSFDSDFSVQSEPLLSFPPSPDWATTAPTSKQEPTSMRKLLAKKKVTLQEPPSKPVDPFSGIQNRRSDGSIPKLSSKKVELW